MRTAIGSLALLLATACQPASEPAPAAEAAAVEKKSAPASPVVLGGVDFSQAVRAMGTEPFWGVAIKSGELVYSGVDRPEMRMANPGVEMHGEVGIIAAKDAAGEDFAVAFRAAQCSDGMSDRVYPLEAEVTYRGETLKGCAMSEAAMEAGARQ